MKQSDIISLVGVAVLGFIISYFLIDFLIDPSKASITYKTLSPIGGGAEVIDPDPDMFNVNAVNPTVEVEFGVCDLNHDGVLSDEEKRKCRCDINRDGELSRDEKRVCKLCDLDSDGEITEDECDRCFNESACDTNNDGVLNDEEINKCRECDLDGNGEIDEEEKEKCRTNNP